MILQYILASDTSTDTAFSLDDQRLWEWDKSKDYALEKYGYRQLKYSCAACIHGHRTLRCVHFTKPLILIKERGQHSSGKANNFLTPIIDPSVCLRIRTIHIPKCPNNSRLTCLSCNDIENCTCCSNMKTVIIDMDFVPLKIVHNGLQKILDIRPDMVAPFIGSALDRHPYRDAQLRAAGNYSKELAEQLWENDDKIANTITEIKSKIVEIDGFSCSAVGSAKVVLSKKFENELAEQLVTNYEAILGAIGPIVTPTKQSEKDKAKKGFKRSKRAVSKSMINSKFTTSRHANVSQLAIQTLSSTGVRHASEKVDIENPLGLIQNTPVTIVQTATSQRVQQATQFNSQHSTVHRQDHTEQDNHHGSLIGNSLIGTDDFLYNQLSLRAAALEELNNEIITERQTYEQARVSQTQSSISDASQSQSHTNNFGQYQSTGFRNAHIASLDVVEPSSDFSEGDDYGELFDDSLIREAEESFMNSIPHKLGAVNTFSIENKNNEEKKPESRIGDGSHLEEIISQNESLDFNFPTETSEASDFGIDNILDFTGKL